MVLFLLFNYIENKSHFNINILKKTFKNQSLSENYPIKNKFFEIVTLLNQNNIDTYNLSDKIFKDTYLRFKIITTSYPIRYSNNSKYYIYKTNEIIRGDCSSIDEKKYLKIIKC